MKRFGIIGLIFLFFLIISIVFAGRCEAAINFSISNPVVNDLDEIEVDATISGLISSSCSVNGCFLQAELQSAGGYFGYTYNNSGEYVDYFKNPSSTDEIKSKLYNFMPVGGMWSGKLKAKNNPNNQNYYGPGDYLLSFRRFSGNSTSPTSVDSNNISVNLRLASPTPSLTPTPVSMETQTPTATSFTLKTPLPTNSVTPTPKPTVLPTVKVTKTIPPSDSGRESEASESSGLSGVLGVGIANTSLPETESNESRPTNKKFSVVPFILIPLGMGFMAVSIYSMIRGAKRNIDSDEKENIKIL